MFVPTSALVVLFVVVFMLGWQSNSQDGEFQKKLELEKQGREEKRKAQLRAKLDEMFSPGAHWTKEQWAFAEANRELMEIEGDRVNGRVCKPLRDSWH